MKSIVILFIFMISSNFVYADLMDQKTNVLEERISQKRNLFREVVLKMRMIKKKTKSSKFSQDMIQKGYKTLNRNDKEYLTFRMKHFDKIASNKLTVLQFKDLLASDTQNIKISSKLLDLIEGYSSIFSSSEEWIAKEIQILILNNKGDTNLLLILKKSINIYDIEIKRYKKALEKLLVEKLRIRKELNELKSEWVNSDR